MLPQAVLYTLWNIHSSYSFPVIMALVNFVEQTPYFLNLVNNSSFSRCRTWEGCFCVARLYPINNTSSNCFFVNGKLGNSLLLLLIFVIVNKPNHIVFRVVTILHCSFLDSLNVHITVCNNDFIVIGYCYLII